MTVPEIRRRLADIEAVKNDDERAHSEEDALHQDVLKAITTMRDPQRMRDLAREALKTQGMDFARWCA